MKERISALLVHHQADPMLALKAALEHQFVKTRRARTFQETVRHVRQENPPHLIFTDPELPDGTWREVFTLARNAAMAVNVIIVAATADIPLYLEVMERGAFDFIVPPFEPLDIFYILRRAFGDVLLRRRHQVQMRPEHSQASLPRRLSGKLNSTDSSDLEISSQLGTSSRV